MKVISPRNSFGGMILNLGQPLVGQDLKLRIFWVDICCLAFFWRATKIYTEHKLYQIHFRAVATGQPSQPMGWPGFWSETVLPYLFTAMWETMFYFFPILIYFSTKSLHSLEEIQKTTWTIFGGQGWERFVLQWAGLKISNCYGPANYNQPTVCIEKRK